VRPASQTCDASNRTRKGPAWHLRLPRHGGGCNEMMCPELPVPGNTNADFLCIAAASLLRRFRTSAARGVRGTLRCALAVLPCRTWIMPCGDSGRAVRSTSAHASGNSSLLGRIPVSTARIAASRRLPEAPVKYRASSVKLTTRVRPCGWGNSCTEAVQPTPFNGKVENPSQRA